MSKWSEAGMQINRHRTVNRHFSIRDSINKVKTLGDVQEVLHKILNDAIPISQLEAEVYMELKNEK